VENLNTNVLPDAGTTYTILTSSSLSGAFTNVASGARIDTLEGTGSFLVHFGEGSPFDPNHVVLSAFIEISDVPGDYNEDGVVNAADYVVWRDKNGSAFDLPNRDPSAMGNIGPADYEFWVDHFGESAASGASSALVPEPTAIAMLLAGALALAWHGHLSVGTAWGQRSPRRCQYPQHV
jgi:hypothetical protein